MELTGYEAIEYAEQHGVPLKKYADPVEDYREDVTPEEARKIASEDPHLIFVDGTRYEVRLIGHEAPNGKIQLHEVLASFDNVTEAKDFATAHSGDGYFGTAIVDVAAQTVDLGDRTEGLDGFILE